MSNDPTIDQMNETIALFMGYEKYEDKYGIWFKRKGLIKCLHPKLQSLQYHSSWDWLMPVAEKIATLSSDDVVHIEIGKTFSRSFYWNLDNGQVHVFDESADTPIQTVYKSVLQFIQWYNNQSNTTNEHQP